MPEKLTIKINKKEYHPTAPEMTGREIKQLAAADGVGSDYELTLEHTPGEGKPERRAIRDDERVTLQNGMRFSAIPPGNRGQAC
jgi:hypothetical protein